MIRIRPSHNPTKSFRSSLEHDFTKTAYAFPGGAANPAHQSSVGYGGLKPAKNDDRGGDAEVTRPPGVPGYAVEIGPGRVP